MITRAKAGDTLPTAASSSSLENTGAVTKAVRQVAEPLRVSAKGGYTASSLGCEKATARKNHARAGRFRTSQATADRAKRREERLKALPREGREDGETHEGLEEKVFGYLLNIAAPPGDQ